jgi:hypothetical protein
LVDDYVGLTHQPNLLRERLNGLRQVQARETLDRWLLWVGESNWPALVHDLLLHHYDPLYERTQKRTRFSAPQQILTPAVIDLLTYRGLAATLADF